MKKCDVKNADVQRICSVKSLIKKVKVKMFGPQGEGGGRGGRRGEEEGWREEGADDDNDELRG